MSPSLVQGQQASVLVCPLDAGSTFLQCVAPPNGLSRAHAGIFLAHHGVSCIVLEQSTKMTTHPQAHYINNRTMELFRAIPTPLRHANEKDDSLAAVVDQLSPPLMEWRRFRYVDQLIGGQVYGDVDHFKGVCHAFLMYDYVVICCGVTVLFSMRQESLAAWHTCGAHGC